MKTSGMGALVISVYKKYDAVLFEGEVFEGFRTNC